MLTATKIRLRVPFKKSVDLQVRRLFSVERGDIDLNQSSILGLGSGILRFEIIQSIREIIRRIWKCFYVAWKTDWYLTLLTEVGDKVMIGGPCRHFKLTEEVRSNPPVRATGTGI